MTDVNKHKGQLQRQQRKCQLPAAAFLGSSFEVRREYLKMPQHETITETETHYRRHLYAHTGSSLNLRKQMRGSHFPRVIRLIRQTLTPRL